MLFYGTPDLYARGLRKPKLSGGTVLGALWGGVEARHRAKQVTESEAREKKFLIVLFSKR